MHYEVTQTGTDQLRLTLYRIVIMHKPIVGSFQTTREELPQIVDIYEGPSRYILQLLVDKFCNDGKQNPYRIRKVK